MGGAGGMPPGMDAGDDDDEGDDDVSLHFTPP